MVSELTRVSVSGALFVFADHLTDRRVDVDNQRCNRSDTRSPRALKPYAVDGFELADMPERERPQVMPTSA